MDYCINLYKVYSFLGLGFIGLYTGFNLIQLHDLTELVRTCTPIWVYLFVVCLISLLSSSFLLLHCMFNNFCKVLGDNTKIEFSCKLCAGLILLLFINTYGIFLFFTVDGSCWNMLKNEYNNLYFCYLFSVTSFIVNILWFIVLATCCRKTKKTSDYNSLPA